jgi:hypothetical protein
MSLIVAEVADEFRMVPTEPRLLAKWLMWHEGGAMMSGDGLMKALTDNSGQTLQFFLVDDDCVEFRLYEKGYWRDLAGMLCQFQAPFEDVVEWATSVKKCVFGESTGPTSFRVNGRRHWHVCGVKYARISLASSDEFELADVLLYLVAASPEAKHLRAKIWFGKPNDGVLATAVFG